MSFFWNSYLLLFHNFNVQNRIVRVNAAHNVVSFNDLAKHRMLAIQMRLRKVRNEELRATRIRASIRHRNHASFMLEIIRFIVDGITRTTRSIAIRVATLDHKARNDTMEEKAIIKPGIGEFNKVRYGIRSGLEVQVHNDFTLMSCYLGKNLGRTRVILVENLPRCKSIRGKAQGTANNKLF